MMLRKYIVVLWTCMLAAAMWSASPVAAQQRPRVSLTLSGGGAKGLAHIGILKAIDSAGLTVDLLTGTSMGSIVGGLYAAGYSGDSIEHIARAINWDLLLSNTIAMNSYIMEEKSEYGKYAVELPVQEKKITLPAGFLESQELWLKLQEVFFPVQSIGDFSKLSIPFRCVGTDLSSGKPYPFTHGNIVQAIRASMAIPGVFSPVDIDGRRFVDGGVVRNFPVKDAVEMGADFKIGVSVSEPLKDVKELDNAFKVLNQVVFLNEGKDREEESRLCDFLINIPMGDYTAASFDQADGVIDLGIAQGRLHYPYFKHLADSLNNLYGKKEIPAVRLPSVNKYRVGKLTVEGLNHKQKAAFLDQINADTYDEVDFAMLQRKTRNAFAYRMYKSIGYQMVTMSDSTVELRYQIKPEASTHLKAGILYNSFTGFGIFTNITTRNWLSPFSRSLLSLSLGDNFRGLVEHQQMFSNRSPLSNRLQIYAENQEVPNFVDFEKVGLYRSRYYYVENLVLRSSKRKWSGGMGMRWEYVNAKPSISSGEYFSGYNAWFDLFGTLIFNSFDKPVYPASGWKAELKAGYVFGLDPNITVYKDGNVAGTIQQGDHASYDNYFRVTAKSETVTRLADKWAVLIKGQAGINLGPKSSLFNSFYAGGLNPTFRNQILFAGLREAELVSESMATLGLGLRWNTFGKFFATLQGNTLLYDFVKKDYSPASAAWLHGTGLTLGYNLITGPIEWTVMHNGARGGLSTYLNFGFPFK